MKIESLDHKGRGIGRLNGKITFVSNALPMEEVEISVIKEKKNYNEAVVKTYLKKSPNRNQYSCPYYKKCGGCHIAHMDYQSQLDFKQNKIRNIVDKYLSKDIFVKDIIYDKQLGYRNKLTLQVQNGKMGLYQNNTHELVLIDDCLICDDMIRSKISVLRKMNLDKVNQLILRCSDSEIVLIIDCNGDIDVSCIYDEFDNIVIKNSDYVTVKGNNYVIKKISEKLYKISLNSFFQVNYGMMEKMYNYVESLCDGGSVLDLYCGTGSIGLYISDVASSVEGVEINSNAILDANYNKKINRIGNISFKCSDTDDIVIDKQYDMVIVDPPRSGLSKKVINKLIDGRFNKIIYVSCDPMTLVRDLKEMSNDYEIISITPFDMFPQTYHVECVCLLVLR